MKTINQILTAILFFVGYYSVNGQNNVNPNSKMIKTFNLDQKEYTCGDANVFLLLFFESDSVKGFQISYGDGIGICEEPSGSYLGKKNQNSIIGIYDPYWEWKEFNKPIPFSISLKNNKLMVSKSNGKKYPFIESTESECQMWANTAINLREKPVSNSKILVKIPNKQQLTILELGYPAVIGDKKGFWTKVKFGNQEGWVFGGFLSYPSPDYFNNDNNMGP